MKKIEAEIRYPNYQTTAMIYVPDESTAKEIHNRVIDEIMSKVDFEWHEVKE